MSSSRVLPHQPQRLLLGVVQVVERPPGLRDPNHRVILLADTQPCRISPVSPNLALHQFPLQLRTLRNCPGNATPITGCDVPGPERMLTKLFAVAASDSVGSVRPRTRAPASVRARIMCLTSYRRVRSVTAHRSPRVYVS